MTDYGIPQIIAQAEVAEVSSETLFRDPLLRGANEGIRFLFDLDFSWCYPGGARKGRAAQGSPTGGQAIYDIAERADGSYLRQGATAVATYAGGGFDFSPITKIPFGVKGPTDAWDSIHDAADRYFLWCGYYRMPAEADWVATNGNFSIFENTPNNGTYITQVDPLVIYQIQPSSTKELHARRQINLGASAANASRLILTPTSDHFGKVCQLGFWRSASGQGFRMKPLDGGAEALATTGVGTETALDFSGIGPVWGSSPTPDNGTLNAGAQAASNYRLYRGFLEDLTISGRTPLTILNADLQRVLARIAASAAANGGTSTIFV